MMGAGINTRVGPICRTVTRTRREVLDVIAGYDPKDPADGVQRRRGSRRSPMPAAASRAAWTASRIGVRPRVHGREALHQGRRAEHRLVERALERSAEARRDDRRSRARRGSLFDTACFAPAGAIDAAACGHCAPPGLAADAAIRVAAWLGEGERYMINKYLQRARRREHQDNADLIARRVSTTIRISPTASRRARRRSAQTMFDTVAAAAERDSRMQTIVLQCMQEQQLDALVSPMSTVPPRKLTSRASRRRTAAADRLVAASVSRDFR